MPVRVNWYQKPIWTFQRRFWVCKKQQAPFIGPKNLALSQVMVPKKTRKTFRFGAALWMPKTQGKSQLKGSW